MEELLKHIKNGVLTQQTANHQIVIVTTEEKTEHIFT